MAPAIRVWEIDAAPQVEGHIYVVTHMVPKEMSQGKMTACSRRAQYEYGLASTEKKDFRRDLIL